MSATSLHPPSFCCFFPSLPHLISYFLLLQSVSVSTSIAVFRSLLSVSLFAPFFIFSSQGAYPAHAHSLNEVLHVHVTYQPSFDPVNMIFSVFLMC